MEAALEVAQKIATPLSLAALGLIIFLYIVKIAFERLNLGVVLGPDVYRIVMRSITYVFILAGIGLLVGVGAFLAVNVLDYSKNQKIQSQVDQLNSPSSISRFTAVTALSSLGFGTAAKFSNLLCESLSGYVRIRSVENPSELNIAPAEDIQSAMAGLSRYRNQGICQSINLTGSHLAGLNLPNASLAQANLNNVNLKDGNLLGATLVAANLVGANLSGAVLRSADLSKARLDNAIWFYTNLNSANLSGATGLVGADLMTVDITNTNFSNVNLRDTKLPD